MNPRAARAAFKAVGIDNHISAAPVLAQLPDQDRIPETEPAGPAASLPQTPSNSWQWVALASQIHSLEHPNCSSRHLWGKMIKAAGQFHNDSVLLHQEVAELCQNLAYKQVRAPGDQSWLSKSQIIDSQEIREAIQHKNALKTPSKRQKRAPRQQPAPPASSPVQESSPAPSVGLYSSSGSSMGHQWSFTASLEEESQVYRSESPVDRFQASPNASWYSDDKIDLLG